MNVEKYLVKEVPSKIYYIPNFINEDEEQNLIKCINNSPKPKWTQLSNRRLQNWGGCPHPSGMIAEPLPKWLMTYIDKVAEIEGIFPKDKKPNHVLINEYLPGQGIMPHTDGPLFYPTVTTISCGSHTVLEFYKRRMDNDLALNNKVPEVSLLLERCSLVIVQELMYENMLHGISENQFDIIPNNSYPNTSKTYSPGEKLERGTRLSLTIRHVPKTRKIRGLF